MSMRVERASLEQVQQRFENLKKRKEPGTFTEQGTTVQPPLNKLDLFITLSRYNVLKFIEPANMIKFTSKKKLVLDFRLIWLSLK